MIVYAIAALLTFGGILVGFAETAPSGDVYNCRVDAPAQAQGLQRLLGQPPVK